MGAVEYIFVSVVTNSQGHTHIRFRQCSSCQDVNRFLWCIPPVQLVSPLRPVCSTVQLRDIFLDRDCPDFSCFLSCTVRANVPRTRYVCNKWRILRRRAEIRNFSSSVEIFVKISSFRAKAHLVFFFFFTLALILTSG